ncbi:M14 family metallopeptidase [Novosphingobium mangrovi (ex Hu et al. 2023)]|uniref:M14 family metallocarboxypeptidase n=1 Tax=Novosphingobium mangrovi (ex Hu et al. 2023) TaxID=2930094 RepID=A0ABT0A7T4_9SPHN|nr:M14 family metallocarboxypeptidase [Novosphingobium mangrovi (ex Hu et al. 2023)]MCJ1959254.1 M14 family metallocarboxypeptidase [Novosphingobium mangrovi (ex Hu et al. 2023)]
MTDTAPYPIGTPGTPWGAREVEAWRATQAAQRRYGQDVEPRIQALADRFTLQEYGTLDYAGERFTLYALSNGPIDASLPTALVTGGVHGYETSGVMGALEFLETRAADYAGRVNLIVAPCVSPWAYERINRWNYDAIDPNRNFTADSPAGECRALVALVAAQEGPFLLHIDLHETTDSDEEEFRPALAARDGKDYDPDTIPDGFYLVDDADNRQPAFCQAIIEAVEKVTHIAPADPQGNIIGSPVVQKGVIEYPQGKYGMCAAITGARFTTTTEVYPDSPSATPEECNAAQVAAVCAALDYALGA